MSAILFQGSGFAWQSVVVMMMMITSGVVFAASSSSPLMDNTGKWIDPTTDVTVTGISTIVKSPGTPNKLVLMDDNDDYATDETSVLRHWDDDVLICRGATLAPAPDGTGDASTATNKALAVCGLVSDCCVLTGITTGDVQTGIANTRHARTLSTLFRAQLAIDSQEDDDEDTTTKTIILTMPKNEITEEDEASIAKAVENLYQAAVAAAERNGNAPNFKDIYDLKFMEESPEVLSFAKDIAKKSSLTPRSLSSTLSNALNLVRESGVAVSAGVDPPHIASAFVIVGNAVTRQSRSARAKIAAWKGRVARGLHVDGFGKDATALRKRILDDFDSETLVAVGLPLVAGYRLEMRSQLQDYIDESIQQVFSGQVANLEKATLKRFNTQLLKTVNSKESTESVMDLNAATMRKEALLFETVLEELQVPELGLTKEKAVREVASKLNDALNAFPDSPAAKLKRTKQVEKIVKKEKAPGRRSIDFGLDLVAMLRPDGFGSLQGYAGYQLPGGNSITFGIHNDADDPQVIAQFGGVRPPLLRVQPKLRLDVEL